MRIAAIAFAALFISPAFAQEETSSPEDLWNGMVTSSNFAYAGRDRAILKIDDTVYLDEGQEAWLVRHDETRTHYLWTLEEPEDYVIHLSYDGEHAMLQHVIINETELERPAHLPEAFPDDEDTPRHVDVRFEADMLSWHDDNEAYVFDDGVQITAYPTQMRPGETGLRAAVFNPNHPEAEHFAGLRWYPYNPDLVIEAEFVPLETFEPITFQTSRGWYKQFYLVGHAHFTLGELDLSMPLYGFTEDPSEVTAMSTFFTDAQSGHETYGVGRYMDIETEEGSFPPDAVTLDFNYAYNPLCARSRHYNCPYAQYDIPSEIRAGEMIPEGH